MKHEGIDSTSIEQIAKEQFGISFDIQQMVAEEIPISLTGTISIFLTKKKQLYAYITAKSPLVLGDVQKIVTRVGLRAELYVPPRGRSSYFDDIGRDKFRKVYPGRSHITDADIRFYRTLAPYNPALILINEVKDGMIYQYDVDARSSWRPSVRFAYRRIMTS